MFVGVYLLVRGFALVCCYYLVIDGERCGLVIMFYVVNSVICFVDALVLLV